MGRVVGPASREPLIVETSEGLTAEPRSARITLRAAWADAPYPVLLADAAGTVIDLNAAAAALFPSARPRTPLAEVAPAWLTEAHFGVTEGLPRPAPVHGEVDGRTFEAHPTPVDAGDVVWWLVDDTDRRLAEEALRTEQKRTAFLAEASSSLLASLNVDRCMEVTAELAARHLADAAVVVVPSAGPRAVAYAGPDGALTRGSLAADPAEVPGLDEALQGFPPVPSRWIDPAQLPAWAVPAGFTGPAGSVLVTPLPGHGVPAGAIILLRHGDRQGFHQSEEIFARLFAARAGAALSAARLYAEQSSITETLMRDLLPPRLHQVHGVEFAGGYRAAGAGEHAGGDFYDVHPGDDADAESLVVLGDVCGKGLEAAVLTGKIRNTVQALLPMAGDHQRVLDLLNGALVNSHHTRFATMVLASVSRFAGTVRLRLTSAGHLAPLIVRADGRVEETATRGSLIGVLPEVTSRTVTADLAAGETCLLFTDGITEARGGPLGGDLFGEHRLRRALAECAGLPAEAVVERVQMLASQWVGAGRHDDMAVVAITAPRTTHLSAVNGHTRGRFTA
ncbi:PP2C family protein-serine/threonine phosphatase [Streptomyces sp. NBC_01497]|uniref:PP2C family protein-serine/threonine phosphatase n=1 Tax=Streptomyces sp. NBC_01497 TaxID=2903885 RepID=UPI002E37B45C|nr:PP2C family protein-serine/threonine phosphatase [Streptomyces sp. NBC_01497]